jgi:hypothetical protein
MIHLDSSARAVTQDAQALLPAPPRQEDYANAGIVKFSNGLRAIDLHSLIDLKGQHMIAQGAALGRRAHKRSKL